MKYFQKFIGQRMYLSPISLEDVEICTKRFNDNINQISKVVTIGIFIGIKKIEEKVIIASIKIFYLKL